MSVNFWLQILICAIKSPPSFVPAEWIEDKISEVMFPVCSGIVKADYKDGLTLIFV